MEEGEKFCIFLHKAPTGTLVSIFYAGIQNFFSWILLIPPNTIFYAYSCT